jgi:NAD(P)H-dependent FMN reductase
MARYLLVCGSRKPAPGVDRPSAARTMLHAVATGLTGAGCDAELIDVRELDLPFFDGRNADQYGSPDLTRIAGAVSEADVVVLSVPAYWGGPSGVVKNLLDLLGGADYDAGPDRVLPLAGKTAAMLVVGADDVSAHLGAAWLRTTLAELGASVAPRAFVVGNPRKLPRPRALLDELADFGRYLATLASPERVGADR